VTRRHVVVDHSPELAWELADGCQPDAGTVVFGITPDMRSRHELGQDLLVAFGKDTDVTGVGRRADEDWAVLPAWFEAHRVHQLFVTRTETLPGPLWDDLLGLADDVDVDVTFVAYRPAGDTYHQLLARHGFTDTTIEDVLASLPGDEEPAIVDDQGRFPAVPADGYLTFLATCRRLLEPDDYARVEARYIDAATAARAWLEAAATVDEATVVAGLRAAIAGCSSYHETVTVLRAHQAAAHNAGWLITIDPMRFTATAEQANQAAVRDPGTWKALAAYRAPYRAAACALAALDWSVDEVLALRIDQVGLDADDPVGTIGETVERSGHGTDHVPAGAAVYLRAQVAYRRRQGAERADPLFAEGNRLLTERTIVDAVRVPAVEVGVNLLSGAFHRRHVDDRTWRGRWGVSVQDIR
jgi:hypothetical protein